jgi:uncharacterized membrane protein
MKGENMRNRIGKWMAAALAVATVGALGLARAQAPTPQTLVYAVYDSERGAKDAFDAMRQSQRQGVINIDSFAVVTKDRSGRVRVQSTQRRGMLAGTVVGAVIGVLGGPAGVAVGAAAGGGIGYLTGSSVGIPREHINAIKASLQPGTSAIVAVVNERWVADLERSLHEAQAKQVLDHRLAGGAAVPESETPPSTAPEGETTPQPNP